MESPERSITLQNKGEKRSLVAVLTRHGEQLACAGGRLAEMATVEFFDPATPGSSAEYGKLLTEVAADIFLSQLSPGGVQVAGCHLDQTSCRKLKAWIKSHFAPKPLHEELAEVEPGSYELVNEHDMQKARESAIDVSLYRELENCANALIASGVEIKRLIETHQKRKNGE